MKKKHKRGIDMVNKNIWFVSFIILIMTIGTVSAGGLEILSIEGDTEGTIGSFANVYINATGADDIGSLTLELAFDNSVITANSVTKGNIIQDGSFDKNIDNANGTIKLALASTEGNSGDGSIAKINFSVIGSEDSSSPLDINLIDLTDSNNTDIIPEEIINSTFTVIGDGRPVINSVKLNKSTPNTGDSILVTVDVTDDVEVVNVSANNVELTFQDDNIWSGTIVAKNGTNSVNVSARDEAGNVAWNNSTSYTATTVVNDVLSPVINSVKLNTSTPNTNDSILITVNVTDNIGVVNVVADIFAISNVGVANVSVDHVELRQNGSGDLWSGTVVARKGIYSVNVSAGDAARNVVRNNLTRYTATDKSNVSFEFSVSNTTVTIEQNASVTYILTIKNTGSLSDTYNLTVHNSNNATVTLSKNSISLEPGKNSTENLTVSSSVIGKYAVNVTAVSSKDPSRSAAINTVTTVVAPSYIKAFHVANGTRAGSIIASVKVVNLDIVGHWFAVVIGGINPITGYPLVGTGTVYLEANETAEKVPILITVPASAEVGKYQLYVGIYNYDVEGLNQSKIIGTIQGPKPSTIS